ncbi:MAG: xanthine dehydrogenase family protein [Thermaerobacter sp.]|nr:xanthine dehydrogenase family protein [Thermaerobacter sp.]
MVRRWSLSAEPRYAPDWLDKTPALVAGVVEAETAPARAELVNLAEMRALPGVRAVLTAHDAPGWPYTTAGQPEPEPSPYDTLIINPVVRYPGEPVALVAADDATSLAAGLAAARVTYQPWTGPLHADCPDGVVARWLQTAGQAPSSGWSLVTQVDVQRVSHIQIEPHAALAYPAPHGVLTVVTTTQVPFHVRRLVARALGMAVSSVRVIGTDVGGGFGGKQEVIVEPWVALLARATGQPVKMMLTRRQEFLLARTRHAATLTVKTQWNGQRLSAIELDAEVATGPYGGHGLTVAKNMALKTLPLYRAQAYRFSGRVHYGPGPVAGAFRGYGGPQGGMAVETHLDEAARQRGEDPAALRRRILLADGDPLDVFDGEGDAPGRRFRGLGLTGLLDACLAAAGWGRAPAPDEGLGLALGMQASGVPHTEVAAVRVALQEDGRVRVATGAVDMGQGAREVLALLVARTLGIDESGVRVLAPDTDHDAFDYGSYASSTTFVTGSAAVAAARDLKRQLRRLAKRLPPASSVSTGWAAGRSFVELAQASCYGPLRGPLVGWGVAAPTASPAPVAVVVARVRVDRRTGQIAVRHLVAGVEVGRVINPAGLRGQVEGAVAQGLGYALCEDMPLDRAGRVLIRSLGDYPWFSATEMPPLTVLVAKSREPAGPWGAKSAGEVAVAPVAPAIANAVRDAVGVRLDRLPMTADRVLAALAGSMPPAAVQQP